MKVQKQTSTAVGDTVAHQSFSCERLRQQLRRDSMLLRSRAQLWCMFWPMPLPRILIVPEPRGSQLRCW